MPTQPIDYVILVVLILFGIGGIRRGLILAVFDVVVLAAAFVAAAGYYHQAGALVAVRTGWSPQLSEVIGFILILVAGEAVRIVGGLIVQSILRPLFVVAPFLGWLNQFAGVVPGLLRGGAYVALII